MSSASKLRSAIGALLFVASAAASAQCVSTVQQVSDYFTSPNRAAGALAFTGSVIGVARNETLSPKPIWLTLYDQSLNQVTEDKIVAPSSRSGALAMFWNGTGYGLFFLGIGGELRLQRVTAGGELIGTQIVVGRPATFFGQEYGFAFDPVRNAYIAVHTIPEGGDAGFWLTIIGTDGVTRFDQRLTGTLSQLSEPRVAVADDGTIGIVRHQVEADDGLRFTALDLNNNVVGFADISANAHRPVIASNGSSFAIVYQSNITGGTEIRWARTDTKARLIAAESRLFSGRGMDAAPTSLVWNAARSEWAVAYLDSPIGFQEFPGEYRLHRMTPAGDAISDTTFSLDVARTVYSTSYPIAWTGSSYVSSGERNVPVQGSVSFLFKHCPFAAAATQDRVTVPASFPVTFTAHASGGTAPYKFTWDFGDFSEARPGETITHSFAKIGTYTVTLTATDVAGARFVTRLLVTVYFPKSRAIRR